MQGLRGIAHEDGAARDRALRDHAHRVVHAARAHGEEAPRAPSKGTLRTREERFVGKRAHIRRIAARDTMHQAIVAIGTRQQCGRTIIAKPFEGGAIGRALGAQPRDEQRLPVIVFLRRDAECIANTAACAVGGHQQFRAQDVFAGIVGHADDALAILINVGADESGGTEAREANQLLQSRFERLAEIARDHDLPEGLTAVIGGLQLHASKVATAAGVDAPDRRAGNPQLRQHAQRRQRIDGGVGETEVAFVEHRRQRAGRGGLDHGHVQAEAVQGDRQAGADQAATHDHHVVTCLHHDMIKPPAGTVR